ncbi:LOG family protein [Candidatus Peregrinibacteria bacterium]|nr:LOG family protein [Candidatus Peregrinibacteria bacterium]
MQKISETLSQNHFRVVIFGSARIKQNDRDYQRIYHLAKRIASEGIDIVTGGGPGVMEAGNKGCQDAARKKGNHSHSIGLTIRLPKEQKANDHIDVKKDFNRFSQRLDYFMSLANVVVVAPGGVGTALEFFYTWQLLQVRELHHVPIILMGKMWNGLIRWVEQWPLKKHYLNPEDLYPIIAAESPTEVIKLIKEAHKFYQRNRENHHYEEARYKI